jgi:hypothetical protein
MVVFGMKHLYVIKIKSGTNENQLSDVRVQGMDPKIIKDRNGVIDKNGMKHYCDMEIQPCTELRPQGLWFLNSSGPKLKNQL